MTNQYLDLFPIQLTILKYEETNPEEEKEKIPSASITRSVLPVAKFEKIFES